MARIFLFILLTFTALPARASVLVVVNAANPVQSMTSAEVAALYLGRTRVFPSGEFALVFDQSRDSAIRARFFQGVASMSQAQVNTYWSRLMFSGQEIPPQVLPNDQAVLEIVRRNPGAIGYVGSIPADSQIKVVFRLDE